MGERWSTASEIKDDLELNGCGPALYWEGSHAYSYAGESNSLICGCTGTGKSRRVLFGMVRNIIDNGEIGLIQDPKGEIYTNTAHFARKAGIDVKVVNFRSPDRSLRWHPLSLAHDLYRSDKNSAQEMIEEIVNQLVHHSVKRFSDSFWVDKHESLLKGIFNLGLEYCTKDEYTFANMLDLIEQDWRSLERSDDDVRGGLFNDILDVLPTGSKAKKLRDYSSIEALRTRNCVMAESTGTLSKFTTTQNIVNMTSGDDLKIIDITAEKAFLLYIITPDDSDIYDMFSSLLVFQLFRHLVKHADAVCGGRLKTRVNVLLDELGNIGRTLTTLPHLLSAGRSRAIRTTMVLQTLSQLESIYGPSRAKTMLGNADCLVCFRSEDDETMELLSRKAGKKTIKAGDYSYSKPIISASELQAMDNGEAIVFLRGKTRFITELPDYLDGFDCDGLRVIPLLPFPETAKNAAPKSVSLLEIKNRVVSRKKRKSSESSYYRSKLFEPKEDQKDEVKPSRRRPSGDD